MTARALKRIALLRGLLHGERAFVGPAYVDVDVTRRCNLRCVGCTYHQPHLKLAGPGAPAVLDLAADRFARLCDELAGLGTEIVVLQGSGEPLLHPHLVDMIRHARGSGLRVAMLTNGTLLDEELGGALLDAGLGELKVSLWATSARESRASYPGLPDDTPRRVVEGLAAVSRARARQGRAACRLILSFVVNRHNASSVETVIDLATQAGCDAVHFTPMHDFRGRLGADVISDEQRARVLGFLETARPRLESLGLGHNLDAARLRFDPGHSDWSALPCSVPFFHARIRVDGVVQPCGRCDDSIELGWAFEEGFAAVWNSPEHRRFRRRSLSPGGLGGSCECADCCYVVDLLRVHRVTRWLPLGRFGRSTARR